MQYCSLQHWILLLPPDTSTTECHFCFGSASSFFLGLLVIAIHSSPVAYWTPSNVEGLSSSVIFFCLFIMFMGCSQQEYWSGLPFPSPVDHVLSELSTVTRLSWVALHGMAHSFTELHKPLRHDKSVIHVFLSKNNNTILIINVYSSLSIMPDTVLRCTLHLPSYLNLHNVMR